MVYEIDPEEKRLLDAAEGLGMGYREQQVEIHFGGGGLTTFTYLAEESHIDESLRPFCWYLEFVVAGAREHGFPREYVRRLLEVPTRVDPDPARAARERSVLGGALSSDGPRTP